MAFNQENLNGCKRILPFNVKVAIWIDAWDSKKEELSQILRMLVGLRKSLASMAHVVREASVEYSTPREGIDKARDKARDKEEIPPQTQKRRPNCLAPVVAGAEEALGR